MDMPHMQTRDVGADGTLQNGDWGLYNGPPHTGVAPAVLGAPLPPMPWGSSGCPGVGAGEAASETALAPRQSEGTGGNGPFLGEQKQGARRLTDNSLPCGLQFLAAKPHFHFVPFDSASSPGRQPPGKTVPILQTGSVTGHS